MVTGESGRGPAYNLHVLVARLDRSADRILRAELDLSYPRFLTLVTLRRTGPVTQRGLAEQLGVTEPTVSRTLSGLAADGLVGVASTPGLGNRRTVSLSRKGRALCDRGDALLERSFAGLLAAADVDGAHLAELTGRLLARLEPAESTGGVA